MTMQVFRTKAILIRAVRPEWVLTEAAGDRLISGTFVDGQEEASCFIADEVGGVAGFSKHILRPMGANFRVALLPVAAVRARGLWVFRKPEEFEGNSAHVVVCSPEGMSRSQYKKAAGKLAAEAILLK